MPIYEYTCGGCRHEFELLVRGNETPSCPECSSPRLDKRFSVPAAHTHASGNLPMCDAPPVGGCDQPGCGAGRCAM